MVETSEDAWTKDFIKEAADQFEENLQNLIKNGNSVETFHKNHKKWTVDLKISVLGTDSELGASFQKLAQTIASAMTDEDKNEKDSASTDFQSAIAQALNDLSATSENLQVVGFEKLYASFFTFVFYISKCKRSSVNT